jgi:hypothetical protein
MHQFNTDEEVKEYIEKGIDKIEVLGECRLYREEQLQITEDVMRIRNSIEWIIRINKVIHNLSYAVIKSYGYAKLMQSPLEDTHNSQMYSFYLEDAVYRDIVLWDLLRQFLNEFYNCGYGVDDEINIFSFLGREDVKNKIGNANARKLKRYLNCAEHKEVRHKLRNQFTHSLDNTSSYIFHRVNSGKMQADLSKMFPKHPYENIVLVLDDIQKYLEFAKSYVGKLEKFLINNIMMVTLECNLKCGKVSEDLEHWNIGVVHEKAEQILNPCDSPCDYAIEHEENYVCKPVSVCYCRINEKDKKYKGKIELHMSYEEMKQKFLEK